MIPGDSGDFHLTAGVGGIPGRFDPDTGDGLAADDDVVNGRGRAAAAADHANTNSSVVDDDIANRCSFFGLDDDNAGI